MKSLPTLLLICCLSHMLVAQKLPDLSGCWRGVITQDKGGFRPEYGMEMYLIQKGNRITGRSFVYFEKYYAEMELEGEVLDGNILQFKEKKINAHKKIEGMEWCLKQATLSLLKAELKGAWEGSTSFGPCVPGKIVLKRSIPRA